MQSSASTRGSSSGRGFGRRGGTHPNTIEDDSYSESEEEIDPPAWQALVNVH